MESGLLIGTSLRQQAQQCEGERDQTRKDLRVESMKFAVQGWREGGILRTARARKSFNRLQDRVGKHVL